MVRGNNLYFMGCPNQQRIILSCHREAENYTDPLAIVVLKDDNIVDNVPRNISTVLLISC